MLKMIVAKTNNNIIGNQGKLPFIQSEDLKRFKELTLNNIVVMGRTTYESLPEENKPLPERTNIVLTRDINYICDHRAVYVMHNIKDILSYAKQHDIFIVGGSEIYKQFLPYCEVIYLTTVHAELKGDSTFPELNENEWSFYHEKTGSADEHNEYAYTFWSVFRRENVKNKFEYISPVPPSVNHYNSMRVMQKGSKHIIQQYPSKDYKTYKKEIQAIIKEEIKNQNFEMITDFKHHFMDITIYFPRSDKDASNYWKCLLDSANNMIYYDDIIVIPRVQRVFYTYNPDIQPHIRCEFSPVDYTGVWTTRRDYDDFIIKCTQCRNWKNGQCKRLQEYMNYKITKDYDIDTNTCFGYKMKK